MCHGDLQPSYFGELILQAASLWELIHLRFCGVVMDTILRFNPSHYAIIRGRGRRTRVERGVSVVKGESIVSIATKQE